MADIFDCLCCLCMCLFDDSARSCCAAIFGIGSCLGQICVYYKKKISGRSQRRFKVLNKLMLLIFSIIAAVLSTIVLKKYISITENIQSIFSNWKLGVIIDIKVQNTCSPDYDLLSNYTSPSTTLGCVCQEETILGECEGGPLLRGCINYQPQDPIQLSNWVQLGYNGYTKVQICGKRSNITFYDLLEKQIINEEECEKNGYKVCKTGNVENSYCVQQNEECPIRGFIIQQNELNEEEIKKNNYEKIYDQGFYSYITKTQETFPIIQGRIIKGKGVCIEDDEISLNSKIGKDYELLTPQPKYCQLDNSFQAVSEVEENALFQYNYATQLVNKTWPHYGFRMQDNLYYKLMFQNQIFYKTECRKNSYQSLKDIPHYIVTLKTITICQTVFAYVFLLVMLYLLIADISRKCYEDCKCISKQIYLINQLVFLYLLAVTIIVSFAYTAYITPIIQDQYDKICFEVSSQQKLKFILDQVKDQGQNLTYSLFIICTVIVVIDFCMQTYICFKKVQALKQLKAQKAMDKTQNQGNQQEPNQDQQAPMYLQVAQNQTPKQHYDQNYLVQQNIYQNPYMIPQNFNQNPYQNQNQVNYPYQQNYQVNNQVNIPQYVDQQPQNNHQQSEPNPLATDNARIQI